MACYKINKLVAFCFTLIIKYLKKKESYPMHNSIKTSKLFRNKFKQGSDISIH